VARVSSTLFIACVVPAVLITVAAVAVDVYAAIFAALAWTCMAICWRWATRRRPSGLLLLTVGILLVRTAVTLATGNTFIYFVQPVFANAGVAIVFIVSLATSTPVVARLAADFYPMEAGVSTRPRVRRLFWRLTLLWGMVCLAKGAVTLWLLLSRSQADFVMAKNIVITTMTGLAVVATIWLSADVAKKEGLLAHA
jgi:intracellular septation protein A